MMEQYMLKIIGFNHNTQYPMKILIIGVVQTIQRHAAIICIIIFLFIFLLAQVWLIQSHAVMLI